MSNKKKTKLIKADKYIGLPLKAANILAEQNKMITSIFLEGASEHPDLKKEKRHFHSRKLSFEIDKSGYVISAFIG